jgi:hypothetical protein
MNSIHPIVPFGMAASQVAIARSLSQGTPLQEILNQMNLVTMQQVGSAMALNYANQLALLATTNKPPPGTVDEAILKAVNFLNAV